MTLKKKNGAYVATGLKVNPGSEKSKSHCSTFGQSEGCTFGAKTWDRGSESVTVPGIN